ncbi:MAG: membrane protein insertion efficiency factor YidD [Oscillospiraceae bacterium]
MFKKTATLLIKLYQKYISSNTQPHCNYVPTCSRYAIEAIERFGVFRGCILAGWRILRCNPFSKGGYDPVPLRFTFKREFKIYPQK